MTTVAPRGTLLTGLVRKPTFEQAIRYQNPNVKIPSREAWFERNSHHLSQFDGTREDVHYRGLVDDLLTEADEANAHAAMQLHYRQQGIPYMAQGPGGPPPPIPPDSRADRISRHEDRAYERERLRFVEERAGRFDAEANQAIMGHWGPGDPPDPPEQRVGRSHLDALRNRALRLGAAMADRADDLARYQPGYGHWGLRDYAGNFARNAGAISQWTAGAAGELLRQQRQQLGESYEFYRDAASVVARAAQWGMHSLASQLARQPQLQPLVPSLGGPGPNPFRGLPELPPYNPEVFAIEDRRRDPQQAHALALGQYAQDRQLQLGDVLGQSSQWPTPTRPMLIYPERVRPRQDAGSAEYIPRAAPPGHQALAQFQANVEPAAQGAAGFTSAPVATRVADIEQTVARRSGRSGGGRAGKTRGQGGGK